MTYMFFGMAALASRLCAAAERFKNLSQFQPVRSNRHDHAMRPHLYPPADTLESVLGFVRGEDLELAKLAANIVWALAPSTAARLALEALAGVAALHGLLARTLDVRAVPCLMTNLPAASSALHGLP